MTDYTKFDAALMASISSGICRFDALDVNLKSQAQEFCSTPQADPFRVVDRRLQALRKMKKVSFNSKTGWTLVKAQQK